MSFILIPVYSCIDCRQSFLPVANA
jgi:hypothetical protein